MTDQKVNHSDQHKQESPLDNFHDEHNYDGIEELDNPPPGWIMLLFYVTIGISILYGSYYFWLGSGPTQEEEYARAVQRAEQQMQTGQEEMEMVLLTDELSLVQGQKIWNDMNCFTCHGAQGEGNAIGPNLTDGYSIHGCDFEAVFNIIKNGEPLKGMTAFRGQLNDASIQKVASYVLVSLYGSSPENQKVAQGDPCEM